MAFWLSLTTIMSLTISKLQYKFNDIDKNSDKTVVNDVPSYDIIGIKTKFNATLKHAVINVVLNSNFSLFDGINTQSERIQLKIEKIIAQAIIRRAIYHRQSFPNLMSHQFPTLLQCHFDRLVHIIILVIRRRLHSVPDRPAISYSTSETYTVSCFSI